MRSVVESVASSSVLRLRSLARYAGLLARNPWTMASTAGSGAPCCASSMRRSSRSEAQSISHCPVAPLREVPLPHTPEGAAGGSKGGGDGGGGKGGGDGGGGGDGQARSDGQPMPMQHALPEKVAPSQAPGASHVAVAEPEKVATLQANGSAHVAVAESEKVAL